MLPFHRLICLHVVLILKKQNYNISVQQNEENIANANAELTANCSQVSLKHMNCNDAHFHSSLPPRKLNIIFLALLQEED